MTVKVSRTPSEDVSAADLRDRLEQAREETIAALERARARAAERDAGAVHRAKLALGLAVEHDDVAKLERKLAEIGAAIAELRDDVRRERERAADRAWQRALPAVVRARREVEAAARRLLDAVAAADAALMQARIAGATCAPLGTMIFGSNHAALQTMLDAFASETDTLQAALSAQGELRLRLLSDRDAGKRGEVVSLPVRTAIELLRAGAAEPADVSELQAWRARGQG